MKCVYTSLCLYSCLVALASSRAAEPTTQPRPTTDAHSDRKVHEYVGDLGEELRVGMTLEFGDDERTLKGTYFYAKYCKEIRIEGECDVRKVILREFDAAGKQTGRFEGEFPEQDPQGHYGQSKLKNEVMVGTWSRTDGSGKRPFYLSLIFSGAAPLGEDRYAGAGFKDYAEVDAFAQAFRSAVLNRDVDKVTGMMFYPLRLNTNGSHKAIRSPKELRQQYDAIFHAAFVKQIEQAIPFHMFARDTGVMLGDGDVWIAPFTQKLDPAGRTKVVPRVWVINN